jgi:hypothetical protein
VGISPRSPRSYALPRFSLRLALPFLILLLSHSAAAQWIPSGTSITTNIQQGQQESVPDGAGGVIVVWTENRSGTFGNDIVAQRFDSAGNPQWGAEGAAICRAPDDQSFPTAVTDQAGGAVFLWRDHRAGNQDIYAQRVNAAGAPLWAVDGLAVATGPLGDQIGPVAVNIGVGQTAFTYTDIDAANSRGVFVQAIDATGATLWGAGGVPVSAVRGQDNPDITDDGVGGITVVWRTTAFPGDIFAQRFTGAGAPVWAAGGVPVCVDPANQLEPRIARVGGAGFFVVWQDSRGPDLDIYTQRLTPAAGAPFFAIDGIAICAAPGAQRHAIVSGSMAPIPLYVWEDFRGGDIDLYGQILIPAPYLPGWGVNGAALVTKPGDQTSAQVQFRPGTGGGIDLAWIDGPDADVYGQRFDSTPSPLWTPGGVPLCTAPRTQAMVGLVSGASNLFTAVWGDGRDGSTFWTFGQSIDDLGTPLWATNGVSATRRTLDQLSVRSAASGDGGVITAWIGQDRGEADVYSEKLDARGVRLWNAKGSDVCVAVAAQSAPAIASDGSGGALVAWIDRRTGGPDDEVYVQRMASTGTPMWTADGVLVCAAPGSRPVVRVDSDGAGGAILAWSDSRGPDRDVYVQHVNSLGVPLLAVDGIALCAAAGDQDQVEMVRYLNGEAVVVWVDQRGGAVDIYAHRLNAAGVPDPGWPVNGAPICIAAGDQDQPKISSDLVVVWRDARGPNHDIYAQSINPASGAGAWALNGVIACNALGDQEEPQIVSSPAGINGASFVTWVDFRMAANPNIFAQRLLSNGTNTFPTAGVAVCTAAGEQAQATIASDVSGGAVIAWQDWRAGSTSDIYAQRVNSGGTSQWTANGVAVCTAGDNQAGPNVVPDGAGGGIVTWEDRRDVTIYRGYAMRIAPQGGLYPTPVEAEAVPRVVQLSQNRPNPFNPITSIDYVLPRAGRARLDVFDSRGRLVATLVNRDEPAGRRSVIWNGTDRVGRPAASGVYYYRLVGGGEVIKRRMVLIR